jgi:hypothetical protein
MKSIIKYSPLTILLISAALGVAQTQPSSGGSAGVQVNPSQVQKKASMPPPSTATKTSAVGKNVQVTTPADSDSWVEQLDVDGNGTAEQTNLVWDSKDKVMFSNSSGTFTCKNGATGSGELTIAVNGTGNKWGRPAGSGFWIAAMDKGACGTQTDALWGCKFDANGNDTACGVATLDNKNDDLIIATAQK